MQTLHSVLLVVAFAASLVPVARAEGSKPNFLFIFADDMAYDTLHAWGNGEIETPNLDRLSARSTTFTHAYNMGSWSGAVCVASRTMLLTGLSVWRAGEIYDETDKRFREQGKMWPQLLEKAGYETYFTGKWHVKANAAKTFSHVRHERPGMPNQVDAGYNRPLEGKEDGWKPWDTVNGGFWKDGKHWSEVLADDALDYLYTASRSGKPFFMYLAFNAPHDPRQAPKDFVDKYPIAKITLPVPYLAEYPFKDAIGCGASLRDEHLGPFPRTEFAIKTHRAEYYALITHLDAQIGRILDKLEETGKADNTYIVFTADHGLACGHHGLLGKQNMYDHSVRVPWMISGPGVAADKKIAEPIYLQDVMPTTLELAGVEKPAHVEFHSVMPVLRGESKGSYDAIYGGYLDLQRMVSHEGHKLILYPMPEPATRLAA